MEKQKIPILLLQHNYPLFLKSIPIFAKEKKCAIEYDLDVGKEMDFDIGKFKSGIVKISDKLSVLILGPNSIPRKIEEISQLNRPLEEFVESYDLPIIIWQGYPDCLSKTTPEIDLKIHGVIMKLFLNYGKSVIPTRNIRDTVLCLRSLAKRVQIVDNPPSLARIKPKMKTLLDAQKFFIRGLYLMGEKRSKELMVNFSSIDDILRNICESEIIYTRTGNPKGVTGEFAKIKNFNVEFIQKSKEILFRDLKH